MSAPGRKPSRKKFAAAVVAVGAGALWLTLASGERSTDEGPSAGIRAASVRLATADGERGGDEAHRPVAMPGAAVPPVAEEPAYPGAAPMRLAALAAEDYRRRARYPPWAHVLEDGEDPILRDRQVTPVRMAGPYGEQPVITVFPDRTGFESPEPVLVYAYLEDDGQRIPAAEMRGEVVAENGKKLAELHFRDDGKEGDAVAGDGMYTAVLEPEPDMLEPLSASYLVRVVATTEEGVERRVATSFLYSNPDAQLTGRFRDRLVDGELVISAEVEVKNSGRFHLEGTLYTAEDGRSVAWSQNSAELEPGRHWIDLRYPGLAFHEKGAPGPYELRFAALSTTTAMPNAKNRLYEHAHVTGPYRLDDFSSEPYNDPDLLAAAEQLENELAGGSLEAEGGEAPPAAPALPDSGD